MNSSIKILIHKIDLEGPCLPDITHQVDVPHLLSRSTLEKPRHFASVYSTLIPRSNHRDSSRIKNSIGFELLLTFCERWLHTELTTVILCFEYTLVPLVEYIQEWLCTMTRIVFCKLLLFLQYFCILNEASVVRVACVEREPIDITA